MLTVLVLIKEYTEEDEQEEDEQVEEEVCDDDESFVTAMGRLWDTGIGFFSFFLRSSVGGVAYVTEHGSQVKH